MRIKGSAWFKPFSQAAVRTISRDALLHMLSLEVSIRISFFSSMWCSCSKQARGNGHERLKSKANVLPLQSITENINAHFSHVYILNAWDQTCAPLLQRQHGPSSLSSVVSISPDFDWLDHDQKLCHMRDREKQTDKQLPQGGLTVHKSSSLVAQWTSKKRSKSSHRRCENSCCVF